MKGSTCEVNHTLGIRVYPQQDNYQPDRNFQQRAMWKTDHTALEKAAGGTGEHELNDH